MKSVIHVSHNQVHQHIMGRDRKSMTQNTKAKRKFLNSYILHWKASLYLYFHKECFSKDQEYRLAKQGNARPTAQSKDFTEVGHPNQHTAPQCAKKGEEEEGDSASIFFFINTKWRLFIFCFLIGTKPQFCKSFLKSNLFGFQPALAIQSQHLYHVNSTSFKAVDYIIHLPFNGKLLIHS